MVLYWGGRRPRTSTWPTLCQQWQAEHDNFSFIPVVSDALPEDQWQGRTGFVHRAVMEDFPDLSGYQVYACGAPIVVESAHADFTTQCQLPEEEFFSDAFTPAPASTPSIPYRRGAKTQRTRGEERSLPLRLLIRCATGCHVQAPRVPSHYNQARLCFITHGERECSAVPEVAVKSTRLLQLRSLSLRPLRSAPLRFWVSVALQPLLRKPAAMPLMVSRIARLIFSSCSPARKRRSDSTCRWLSGSM